MSRNWEDLGEARPSEECRSLAPLLAAFAEGALSPEEMRSVSAHVDRCAWCTARMAMYAEVDALVRQAPTSAPPPALRTGLYARIAAHQAQVTSDGHRTSELETIVRETETRMIASNPKAISPRSWSGSRRIARWVSAVAALLVVALLSGLFVARQQSRSGTDPATNPTATSAQRACTPGEVQASLPARSSLAGLAMTGVGSGWAVGAIADSDLQRTTYHALIMQYSDCQWQPIGFTLPDAALGSIAMVSSSEGWAAGKQGQGPLLLHYRNGTWSKVTPPNVGTLDSFSVWALSTGDVWVVGQTPADAHGHHAASLLHLSAGHWTRIDLPYENVSGLAPVGHDNVWLIGDAFPGLSAHVVKLAHYQGSTLTEEVTVASGTSLGELRMFAPDDGWATGTAYIGGNDTGTNPIVTRPVALHYDGSRWVEAAIGVTSQARYLVILARGEAWSYTMVTTPANGAEHIAATQRKHAGHWQSIPFDFKNVVSLSRLTCVTPDDCWAVGSYFLPDSPLAGGISVKSQAPLLLRYANGSWHEYGRNS